MSCSRGETVENESLFAGTRFICCFKWMQGRKSNQTNVNFKTTENNLFEISCVQIPDSKKRRGKQVRGAGGVVRKKKGRQRWKEDN